jgi:hypothetical protein
VEYIRKKKNNIKLDVSDNLCRTGAGFLAGAVFTGAVCVGNKVLEVDGVIGGGAPWPHIHPCARQCFQALIHMFFEQDGHIENKKNCTLAGLHNQKLHFATYRRRGGCTGPAWAWL